MEPAGPLKSSLRVKATLPWLAGPGAERFAETLAKARAKLKRKSGRGPVVVAAENTADFLAGVWAAREENRTIVLANPRWGVVERVQAAAQMAPGLWLGDRSARWPKSRPDFEFKTQAWSGMIFIPTGGSGGRVRWAMHTWVSLSLAARALAKFLDAAGCTHVGLLPPWHIGGLMPAVRALETGGTLWLEDWRRIEAGHAPATPPERALVSLVPTQLQRVLTHRRVITWLRQTRAILLGGAAASPALLERARQLRLPIVLAYGMTETAAVVATQTPADFLAGQPPVVSPLLHAKIWVGDDTGRRLPRGRPGRVWIETESLFAGYFPARRKPGPWGTEDRGVLDARGRLRILGRLDRVINTGGEKVHPEEMEKHIRATGLVEEVKIIGLPDVEWGERVAAIYTGKKRADKKLRAALRGRLAAHALPKVWMHAASLETSSAKNF